jgi:hypothetical protein
MYSATGVRCSNIHMQQILRNNKHIDSILGRYEHLCVELDTQVQNLAT